jgi:hypothetical protein
MIDLLLDWRTAGRWRCSGALRGLFAGEGGIPALPLPRFVTRWLCQACETHYLGTESAPQYCPRCHRPLGYVASWDLLEEGAPRWWRDALDPGERP